MVEKNVFFTTKKRYNTILGILENITEVSGSWQGWVKWQEMRSFKKMIWQCHFNENVLIYIVKEINIHTCHEINPGLDIGYVPAGPHAFLRLSGQFGPPQFIFHWPEGPFFYFFLFFFF